MQFQYGTCGLSQLGQGDVEVNNGLYFLPLTICQSSLGLEFDQQNLGCQSLSDRL